MRRRAAYWLVPIIAIGVAVFIIYFLIQINPSTPRIKMSDVDDVLPPNKGDGEKGWMDKFAGDGEKGYFYPVNELYLNLDTDNEERAEGY
ncbi:hypothetical protein [Sulfuricurvum sp.]|uniref:hypothetical protein n=1 Tax=Sulfuricurvum sp. TaxID=2025608 RepID=UPI0019AA337C|nr:hypothetical protein [Sulfuricurvum sp.]MBD3798415.1 hypothetical protein [Campylobacterota bacterium]MBD3806786.1 hypothetical protein [Sulfuricurvum sp.]